MSKPRAETYPWERVDPIGSAKRAKHELGQDHNLLSDDVTFGLQLLRPMVEKGLPERPSLTGLAVILMFRRVIEALDAMDLLIGAGSVAGAQVQTRSAMEGMASMLHLVRVNNEFVSTALLLGSLEQGMEEHRHTLAQHVAGSGPTIVANDALDKIHGFISEDRVLKQVKRELDQLRHERGLGVRWFEIGGGPRTIEALVKQLKVEPLEKMFDIAYGPLSRTAHCENVLEGAGEFRNARRMLRPVRDAAPPKTLLDNRQVVLLAHAVFLVMVDKALGYFGPQVGRGPQWYWDGLAERSAKP